MPVAYFPGVKPPVDDGGEPPDNGAMEARVAKLEAIAEKTGEKLSSIDVRLAKLETRADTFATKEDLHRELHGVTWKLGVAIILAQLLPAIPAMLRALKLIA